MSKFHINPETGRAGKCSAKSPESCKFSLDAGNVVAHYETKEEAKAAYEKFNKSKTLNTVQKKTQNTSEKTIDENRRTLETVVKRITRLNDNLRSRKSNILKLEDSLNLDKTKSERDEIYEKIKKHKEDSLYLDQKRKEALKEQRELARTIEKQQAKRTSSEGSYPVSEIDKRIHFNQNFFSGGCGGRGGC